MLKQFLLFQYSNGSPNGGWHDFTGSFETAKAAIDEAKASFPSSYHIIDIETGNVVDWKQGK